MTSTLLSFLLNGVEASGAPATSRALNYGDGVFRTVLRFRGEAVDMEGQLDKLIADARRIGLLIEPGLRLQLENEIGRVASDAGTAVLKVMLVRGGTGRGYAPDGAIVDRYVTGYRPPRYPSAHWDEGIELQRSSFVLGDQPALAGIKHLNRLEQVLAYRTTSPGSQEILLGNAHGHWICGGRTNIFLVSGRSLLTPELLQQGVSGRMRERVLTAAATLGIEAREGIVTEAVIDAAGELFVTNSLIGIWPVRRLGARDLAAPGPITRRLMDALAHPRLN